MKVPILSIFILFVLAMPAVAQEDADPQLFAKRLQAEIAECRQKAATIRQTLETDWKQHDSRMRSLQQETDDLNAQLTRLTAEIDALQQENHQLTDDVASLRSRHMRLNQLLPGKTANQPLPARLTNCLTERQTALEQAFALSATIPTVAVSPDGQRLDGTAVHYGPLAIFSCAQGYGQLFASNEGGLPQCVTCSASPSELPLDITGKHPDLLTETSGLLKHLRQGGLVMIPILLLGAICLLTVIVKCVGLVRYNVLQDLNRLEQAADHSTAVGELFENELFDLAQQCLTRRERGLSWLSVSASAAPLLGLLGTVTGMIHTFRLITLFGVGDARLLADGISEALITTEAGLCVAIPALLCHAWLARQSKRLATVLDAKISELTARHHN